MAIVINKKDTQLITNIFNPIFSAIFKVPWQGLNIMFISVQTIYTIYFQTVYFCNLELNILITHRHIY